MDGDSFELIHWHQSDVKSMAGNFFPTEKNGQNYILSISFEGFAFSRVGNVTQDDCPPKLSEKRDVTFCRLL